MNILCFGDSNTWGMIPMNGARYDFYDRWPNILGSLLSEDGVDVNIIEEGLNGRTANETDYEEPFLNGRSYMAACVLSHRPVDVLIVMLGTNDIKVRYAKSASQIASSIRGLVHDMKAMLDNSQMERVKVVLVAPKRIDMRVVGDGMFDNESLEKSEALGAMLEEYADREGWYFVNGDNPDVTLGGDGIHLSGAGQRNLAKCIYDVVSKI